MYHQSEDEERRKAWTAAKPAVRAYTRDPSGLNAMKVKTAWPVMPAWQGHVWRDRNFVVVGEAWSNALSSD